MGVGQCDAFWLGVGGCGLVWPFLAGFGSVWVVVGKCTIYNYLFISL